jgi:hypothetical protein
VLYGIQKWIEDSGFCLSSLVIDGEDALQGNAQALFARNVASVSAISIGTKPFASLYRESLEELGKTLEKWRGAGGQERDNLLAEWRQSPGASFLSANDTFLSKRVYEINDENIEIIKEIIDERSGAADNPVKAFFAMENDVKKVTDGLSDLSLDIQRGKDRKAAQTVEDFSILTQKIFTLFPLVRYALIQKKNSEKEALLLDEFNKALREFLDSYGSKDFVLSGDLAEYEIAPRFKEIYMSLKEKLTDGY